MNRERRIGGLPRLAFAASLAALAGCFGNVETPFPPGLEPWEENVAAFPFEDGDPYPETIEYAVADRWEDPETGLRATNLHARGYVLEDTATVFEAARDPRAGLDRRRNVDSEIILDVEPEYRWSHLSILDIDDIIDVTVELTWRHGIVEGTDQEPLVTATRWQKTAGTTAVTLLEASLVCRAVPGAPGVTAVEYQYHLRAADRSGPRAIERIIQVYYDSIVALAHDEPLPDQN
ncbi:MAG: hypothetical protein ACFCGT_04115 [Sandaracinaceae bacterium]